MTDLDSIQAWLGIPTHYQRARFNDPTFDRTTSVVRFLTEEFGPSGRLLAVINGATGSGKSYGAMAWFIENANAIARFNAIGRVEHVSAAFLTAYDLAELIWRKDFAKLDRLKRVQLLFIDELGTEPGGFKGQDFMAHLENLVNSRLETGRQTLLVTNYTPEQFCQAYGDRIYSRIFEQGMAHQTTDPDFRKQGRHAA